MIFVADLKNRVGESERSSLYLYLPEFTQIIRLYPPMQKNYYEPKGS